MQVRGDSESSSPALSESPLTFIPTTILKWVPWSSKVSGTFFVDTLYKLGWSYKLPLSPRHGRTLGSWVNQVTPGQPLLTLTEKNYPQEPKMTRVTSGSNWKIERMLTWHIKLMHKLLWYVWKGVMLLRSFNTGEYSVKRLIYFIFPKLPFNVQIQIEKVVQWRLRKWLNLHKITSNTPKKIFQ